VTTIYLGGNQIGDEGAAALACALQVNMSVTTIYLSNYRMGDAGATALADALQVIALVKYVNLDFNQISDEVASALVDALRVTTSVTTISLYNNDINASILTTVSNLIARNKRLRHLFLYDARRMLLSVMCADECGVVWPYFLGRGRGSTDGIVVPDDVAALRATFASIVANRLLQQSRLLQHQLLLRRCT
jgi:Ran GTPase-activating protein (RanGAP) involved in mRNA processing and transport